LSSVSLEKTVPGFLVEVCRGCLDMKRFEKSLVQVCLAGVLLAFLFGCALRKNTERIPDDFAVADDPTWEAVFQQTQGWTGADGINTADLLDGRVLWMFGDTWIGEIHQGRHSLDSELVNNSLAVHEKPDAGNGLPPDPKTVRFYWKRTGQKNQAWIRPDCVSDPGWYWPAGNGLMVKDDFGNFRLLFFMNILARSPNSDEMWAFYRSGNAMMIVNNPGKDVYKWRIHKVSLPLGIPDGNRIGWGVTLLSAPVSEQAQDRYLYIYGIDESDLRNKKLILARSLAGRVEEMGAWQVYQGNGVWGTFAAECHPIAEHLASELSVEPVVIGKTLWYVMVHSEEGFGSRILVRMSQNPEGPWSTPFAVYQVEGIGKDNDLFTYAAKSHACISRPGELLISYVVNAFDFERVIQNAEMYRPRFIRLSLNRLLPQHDEILLYNRYRLDDPAG
jgi:hypothetical protein